MKRLLLIRWNKILVSIVTPLAMALMFWEPLDAAPPTENFPGRTSASKRMREMDVVLTNESGKLKPGQNSFCVQFLGRGTGSFR
jgi:hypothetical protein